MLKNPYLPHTPGEIAEMLARSGVRKLDDLFEALPDGARQQVVTHLPPLSELELTRHLQALASRNVNLDEATSSGRVVSFLGAGAYDHAIPAAVWALASRGEFLTAYTPYQAELMQGWLQALYEYQGMIEALMGMDLANASMYDGATATAEAIRMALSLTGKETVYLSRGLHPRYREVISTLLTPTGARLVELPLEQGLTVGEQLHEAAAVVVQSPNFLGLVEDVATLSAQARTKGTLIIQVINDPTSLGLLKPPGELGVDIVAAEGQPLGNPVAFGGPHLGILACRAEFVRHLPGRLVGLGKDKQGREGYVLTLQTREQHVRRERATSNICTNQSLNALAAAIYLALLGPQGLREVAELSAGAAAYARDVLAALPGFRVVHQGPHFHEFVLETPIPPKQLSERLLGRGVLGGYPLGEDYPEYPNGWLLCFTERHSFEDVDALAQHLLEVIHA